MARKSHEVPLWAKGFASAAALGLLAAGCSSPKQGGDVTPGSTPTASAPATPDATPSSTPTEVETTPTPSVTETNSKLVAALELLSVEEFEKMPFSARSTYAFAKIKEARDRGYGSDCFYDTDPEKKHGDLTTKNGDNLSEYNPFEIKRKPTNLYADGQTIILQQLNTEQLTLCWKAGDPGKDGGADLNVTVARKLVSGLVAADPSSKLYKNYVDSIYSQAQAGAGRLSAADVFQLTATGTGPITQNKLPDGTPVSSKTVTFTDKGRTYTNTLAFVPIPELGNNLGAWLLLGEKRTS